MSRIRRCSLAGVRRVDLLPVSNLCQTNGAESSRIEPDCWGWVASPSHTQQGVCGLSGIEADPGL
jgi:hypothetical protein